MNPILLDTGCIVALLDRGERYHAATRKIVAEIGDPLVTCEVVIAEACYLLRDVAGAADAVLANVASGVFGIPLHLTAMTQEVRALIKRYANVPMDLADACLVRMAEVLGTARILTLDRDFSVYRWRQSRPFDLLVEL